MAGNAKLSVTMSMIDKATGPLRSFNSALKKTFAPFRDLKNGLRLTSKELGIPKIKTAFGRVGKSIGGVKKELKSLAKSFTIVGGIAAGVLGGIVVSTANAGDAAAKTAQKVGVSTQAWTEMAHAANMSNVSADTLKGGMTRLNKSITDAAKGSKQALYWFDGLGVSIRNQNGSLKSADEMMGDVAEKLAAMPDGAKKSRIAAEVFGRSVGPELIPMLNEGKAGIEAMREEARELALTFTDDESKAAVEFNDSLTRVRGAIKGVVFSIGKELIPVFTPLLKEIKSFIVTNRELVMGKVREWLADFQKALPKLKTELKAAWDEVKRMATRINELVDSFGGWKKVLKVVGVALAALKLAPLAIAVGVLTKAVLGLGAAFLTTPIGWITLAIAGLVMGFRYLWKNCEGFRNFWTAMWDKVSSYIGAAVGRIREAFDKGLIQGIVAIIKEFNPLLLFMSAMSGIAGYISSLDIGIGDLIDAAILIISSFSPIGQFRAAFGVVISFLGELGKEFFKLGASIVGGLWDGLKGAWNGVVDWLKGAVADLTGWMPDRLKKMLGLDFELPSLDAPVKALREEVQSQGIVFGDANSMAAPSFGAPLGAQAKMVEASGGGGAGQKQEAYIRLECKNLPKGMDVTTQGVNQVTYSSNPFEMSVLGGAAGGIS